MKPPAQGIHRFAQVLTAAGVLGFAVLLAIDIAMPGKLPDTLREDRLRLSKSPELISRPKSASFLELSDGAAPARIPNFEYLEPQSRRLQLRQLKPGTEVIVLRPAQASDWLAPFDIVAVKTSEAELLTTADTLQAHRAKTSGSRMVMFWIGFTGIGLLAARRALYGGANAA
jgi:hypothetical protein